jgi:hypothetical protein
MEDNDLILFDGILWDTQYNDPIPICPKHHLRLRHVEPYETLVDNLYCAECTKPHRLKRNLTEEKSYLLDKIQAKIYKGRKYINLDNEAIPLAKEKKEKNDYFVTAILTESKVGLRMVIYAGKKGSRIKSQIFVEPQIKRLAFDQSDLHPSDVFTKLEGTFADGTRASIENLQK